ncbi:MAG TPA: glycosyltransferase family 4 protein [Fimbriimonas sp.]|nr:glycosyltransferase family 4 protein [Fimbriimonas sp.]
MERIAFVTMGDSRDVRAWSGTYFHLAEALERHFKEVVRIGDFTPVTDLRYRIRASKARLHGQSDPAYRTLDSAKAFAQQLENQLKGKKVDAILAHGSRQIAFFDAPCPVYMLQDCPFGSTVGLHVKNASRQCLAESDLIERQAARHAKAIIQTSEWAREEAVKHLGVAREKVSVIPLGANLDTDVTYDTVEEVVDNRGRNECRLLFMGVDWDQKGGAIALEATRILNKEGFPARLTVVGCDVPSDAENEPWIQSLGFISKGSDQGRRRLQELFKDSHLFVLPTRMEAFGIVFCEAASFGVPSIAPNRMGVPGAAAPGQNAVLVDDCESPAAYAKAIRTAFENEDGYRSLCLSSFERYKKELNWDATCRSIKELMQAHAETGQNAA